MIVDKDDKRRLRKMSTIGGITIAELGRKTGISPRTIIGSVKVLLKMMDERNWVL